ncbi:septum formation initiator family protein [Barrientosiimonas marina]|uniref:Septum formation initiator family protein n=1 Tax=Lentibacillus kimchii TaxID=1542911 RepID=A0ABW2URR2_9BACI
MPFQKKDVTRLESHYMQEYDAYVERQARKKKRLIRRLVLFSLLMALAIGSLAVYHVNQQALYTEKKEQHEALQSELAALEDKEDSLRNEIDLLNNEDYVLDIARTNYFFSKKDELIFNIPGEKPDY